MSAHSLDLVARAVLEQYPVPLRGPLTPLGNHGGFSGARLWRVGECCLRAWPAEAPPPDRLGWIHRLMSAARITGLSFVPAVVLTSSGISWVEQSGRCWDLTAWQPGRADFHERPTAQRLAAACIALARVHAAWENMQPDHGPCLAVRRRVERFAELRELLESGWRPDFPASEGDSLTFWARRGWNALQPRMHRCPASLLSWLERPVPLQPCVGDPWHDHVLFQGEIVTGLIDYGSARVDHVAADLARLLGSLIGDDRKQWEIGLAAYSAHRQLLPEENDLARLLDETGTLLGAANWLCWLYRDNRPFTDRAAVARRLAALVQRIEGWQ